MYHTTITVRATIEVEIEYEVPAHLDATQYNALRRQYPDATHEDVLEQWSINLVTDAENGDHDSAARLSMTGVDGAEVTNWDCSSTEADVEPVWGGADD